MVTVKDVIDHMVDEVVTTDHMAPQEHHLHHTALPHKVVDLDIKVMAEAEIADLRVVAETETIADDIRNDVVQIKPLLSPTVLDCVMKNHQSFQK